jgi:hypothetical protein
MMILSIDRSRLLVSLVALVAAVVWTSARAAERPSVGFGGSEEDASESVVNPVPTKVWTTILPGSNSREAPVIVDLDQDGVSEIVIALTGQNWADRGRGRLEVLRADGRSAPGWPVDPAPDGGCMVSALAVSDIDGDSEFEIVAGVVRWREPEGFWGEGVSLEIHAYRRDGDLVEGFPLVVYQRPMAPWVELALADLDRDGFLDFVVTYWDSGGYGTASALSQDGRTLPGWPRAVSPNRYVSPVCVGDLDGDGELEIALGSDRRGVFLLSATGEMKPGWPIALEPDFSGVPITCGDVDKDGEGEIVACSRRTLHGLFVWSFRGDQELFVARPPPSYLEAEAALVNIDRDAALEIVVPTFSRGRNGWLDVWKIDGSAAPGWPVPVFGWIEGGHQVNVVVADIDGDRDFEILLGAYTADIDSLPPSLRNKGWLFAWHHNGVPVTDYPIGYSRWLVGYENGALAAGDVTGDGTLDVVMVRCEEAGFPDPKTYVTLFSFGQGDRGRPPEWSRYHHDPHLTGNADAACSDGTVIGTCSRNKPLFCRDPWSRFHRTCALCGCPPQATCTPYGWCRILDRVD